MRGHSFDVAREGYVNLLPVQHKNSREPGDAEESLKSEDTGVVRWAVEVFNQKDELVATYDLLTENVP